MRLLADENFPGETVFFLRRAGHDVSWVREDAPGSDDDRVLSKAQAENRILLTFDKDFGELAFHSHLPASSGVVLFRISMDSTDSLSGLVARILKARPHLTGFFTVVEEDRIRMTELPK